MKQQASFLTILLLCALGYMPGAAQQHFNKRYTLGASANLFTSVIERNTKFYVIMNGIDSINYVGGGMFKNKTGLRFCVMDSEGKLLQSKLYQRDDKIYTHISRSNNLIALKDGTFLHCFSVQDTALAPYNTAYYNTQLAIAKFDSLGDVLLYKEYDRPNCYSKDATNHILMDFKPDNYGNWLMLSSVICRGQVVFCLRKLDSSFNEVWLKNFSANVYHNTPQHLLIEEDGYVMSGGVVNRAAFPNYYTSLIIKCDTSGKKLWDWQNNFDSTHIQYTINDILRSKDGGYVYCGSGEGVPTYFSGKKDWADILVRGWVEKLDASRNSVWKKQIGKIKGSIESTQQTVLKELPNGDLLIAGTIAQQYDSFYEDRAWIRGCLTCLNGKDGSILWQRLYQSPDKNDTMYLIFNDMRQTADGGYILAGEARNAIDRGLGPVQRSWLVKVDSNGCEGPGDPQCKPVGVPELTLLNQFSIYPNPSEGIFHIHSAIGSQAPLPVTVYDLLGRVLMKQKLSFTNSQSTFKIDAPKGTYILEIGDLNSTLHRERIIVQ